MGCSMIKTELAKSYTPQDAEGEVRAKWDQARAFHADLDAGGEPFCIMIPPPNVTAALHLGHALNNTLQDVLVRYHRMKGDRTLWMPGTDHAGIATQTVVEKRLMQTEGRKRTDFERDAFVAKVQQWKDEYEATILDQLKAMGCSCDYDRTRFTMDEVCAKAVREAFFQLFKDGLIYRGKRLVNWDPVTQTALADDEVEMQEVDGHFWYLRYPLVHPPANPDDPKDCQEVTWSELAARGYPGAEKHPDDENAWVTVATTRPETYLGDTAVAVHPDDPRAKSLRGLMVQLPLVGRVIPIIEDDYVVMPDRDSSDAKAQYATGFLKVTPAHDPNDYDIGQRHDLPIINVMAPDATISDRYGWDDVGDAHLFVGKSREEARKLVVKEFEARGLLEATREYRHSVGHSYRSHVPIEPYLSDQWYVKVTDDRLKGEALRAMAGEQYDGEPPVRISEGRTGETPVPPAYEGDGELRFFPARYAKTFQQWHENLRDWCISRQLWWGHRIPVWTRTIEEGEKPWDSNPWASAERATYRVEGDLELVCVRDEEDHEVIATLHEAGFTQDPDVLDTWFSSALWPISTLGWPDPDAFSDEIPEGSALLDTFNPSSALFTARDIITLWVSRMVMFNRYFRGGKVPFRHVYIHPMIQDGHGQRMSKSLGNGVDPRDIIGTHGADALRYTLTQIATTTQDVRLPVDLVCPHTGETFTPKMIQSPAGYTVPAPIQSSPSDPSKKMVTAYGVASGQAEPTDEMPLAVNASQKFDLGRNFANKLWNATRFALSHLSADNAQGFQSLGASDLSLVDRWMLTRLHRTLHTVEDAIVEYQFNVYADAMYDLVWREFCDWYLEAIKPTVKDDPNQQQVLRTVLNAILRMLHPIMPFVTETLWPHVQESGDAGITHINLPPSDLLVTAPWPDIACRIDDDEAARTFERVQGLVEAIRTIRGERNVPPKKKITLIAPEAIRPFLDDAGEIIRTLAGLEDVQVLSDDERRPDGAIPFTFEARELHLSGIFDDGGVDLEAERTRLTKLIAEKEKAISGYRNRLANDSYVKKAPAHLVEETRQQLAQAEQDLAAAKNALESLSRS